MLENAADRLASYYQLPPLVQGTIVLAVGSSFPEISTVVISILLHGEFDLGVASITGSAIFNILVIPGIAGVLAGKMSVSRELIYKDGQFYILALAILLLTFSLGVIYYPVEGADTLGEVNRVLAIIPLALYGLYLFLQQQDTREFQKNDNGSDKTQHIRAGWEWGKFILGLLLILLGVDGLIRSVIFVGDYLGTPSFFWGATVLAAVTSAPDLIVSVRAAKKKEANRSMGNVLGSNIFDLLVAIPIGVLLAGSAVINFSQAVPMLFFLIVVTILYLVLMRQSLNLNVRESWLLIGIYLLFIAWLIAEIFGPLNWLI